MCPLPAAQPQPLAMTGVKRVRQICEILGIPAAFVRKATNEALMWVGDNLFSFMDDPGSEVGLHFLNDLDVDDIFDGEDAAAAWGGDPDRKRAKILFKTRIRAFREGSASREGSGAGARADVASSAGASVSSKPKTAKAVGNRGTQREKSDYEEFSNDKSRWQHFVVGQRSARRQRRSV